MYRDWSTAVYRVRSTKCVLPGYYDLAVVSVHAFLSGPIRQQYDHHSNLQQRKPRKGALDDRP